MYLQQKIQQIFLNIKNTFKYKNVYDTFTNQKKNVFLYYNNILCIILKGTLSFFQMLDVRISDDKKEMKQIIN